MASPVAECLGLYLVCDLATPIHSALNTGHCCSYSGLRAEAMRLTQILCPGEQQTGISALCGNIACVRNIFLYTTSRGKIEKDHFHEVSRHYHGIRCTKEELIK